MQTEIAKITASIRAATQTTTHAELSCPNCSGDGWIVRDVEDLGHKAFPCECQISSRIACRIPQLYHNARLTDFKDTTTERVAKFFSNSNSLGLLISGSVGAGKTYLAAAIARVLIEAKADVLFLEVSRLFSDLRAAIQRDESEEVLLSQYIEVSWLVLDDLGAGSFSDFERRIVLDLLNRRGNGRRKTVVTSNLELHVIAEKLDERIASRLSAFDQIETAGKDRRAQKGTSENPALNARGEKAMQRDDEMELWDAADQLDLPKEVLGRMIEQGKLKCRRADGAIYLLRQQIEDLIDRQIEEARSQGGDFVVPEREGGGY